MNIHTFQQFPIPGKNLARTAYQLMKRREGRKTPSKSETGLGRWSFRIDFSSEPEATSGFVFKKFLQVTVNQKSWIAVPGEQLCPDEIRSFALILIPCPKGSDNADDVLRMLKDFDSLNEVLVIIGAKQITFRYKGQWLENKLSAFFEQVPKFFEEIPKEDILERRSLRKPQLPDYGQLFFDAILEALAPTRRRRKSPTT
ncbi:MAG: hypothetical protein HGB37_02455 [Candidatus Moranbacteria bacterium]|nr:hypothetical protein [Candidatus Moranbacteria bacterium]